MHSDSDQKKISIYIFLVLLLLPIDWLSSTGFLLREFGAKPANILLTIGGLYGLTLVRPPSIRYRRVENIVFKILIALMLLNIFAFLLNNVFGWSDIPSNRSPFFQFISQTLLVCASFIAVIGNARILSKINFGQILVRELPFVAAIHFFIWVLEFLFPEYLQNLLVPFRIDGLLTERPSGFMSEPSYYGVMASIFGLPFIISNCFQGRLWIRLLGFALISSAIYIGAKTAIIVACAQIIFILFFEKRGRLIAFFAFLGFGLAAIYFIQNRGAIDVENNLSSSMRLGSANLAVNLAGTGVALTGIGAGQFHFMYREQYAPDYLLLSQEALSQMDPEAMGRASTYNLPLRLLVEFGVVGFALIFLGLWCLIKSPDEVNSLPYLLLFGALGFLLTQDTYFYPPLVFACALLLAGKTSNNHE